MGNYNVLREKLGKKDFPLIQKPLIGSGSRGVQVIRSIKDLEEEDNNLVYLQQFIEGTHYNVYFIGEEICPLEKPPLSNEHVPMDMVELTEDIKEVIDTWRLQYNLLFGHLDIIREESSDKLYVVDPGSFPVFTNWKLDEDPVPKICGLILNEYKRLSKTLHH